MNTWKMFKKRWFPKLFAVTAKAVVKLLLATCRIKVHGVEKFISTVRTTPSILMLWHSKLVIISEILNRTAPQFIYTAFISKSRDGDPLAALAESYKAGRALRVAHNGRHLALSHMIGELKQKKTIYVVTPDGPRGPAKKVKPGIALAAREADAVIIPFTWKADKYWELNTWDKMQIPKPFSTVNVFFGEPASLNGQHAEQECVFLESLLEQ